MSLNNVTFLYWKKAHKFRNPDKKKQTNMYKFQHKAHKYIIMKMLSALRKLDNSTVHCAWPVLDLYDMTLGNVHSNVQSEKQTNYPVIAQASPRSKMKKQTNYPTIAQDDTYNPYKNSINFQLSFTWYPETHKVTSPWLMQVSYFLHLLHLPM